MTKEKLIERMDTYLLVVSHGFPLANLHGKEDLADAILKEQARELEGLWLKKGTIDVARAVSVTRTSSGITAFTPPIHKIEWRSAEESDALKKEDHLEKATRLLEEFEQYIAESSSYEIWWMSSMIEEFIADKRNKP